MKFTRQYVANEWDFGWFCTKCDCLNHWRMKAYVPVGSNAQFCEKCAKEMQKREENKNGLQSND